MRKCTTAVSSSTTSEITRVCKLKKVKRAQSSVRQGEVSKCFLERFCYSRNMRETCSCKGYKDTWHNGRQHNGHLQGFRVNIQSPCPASEPFRAIHNYKGVAKGFLLVVGAVFWYISKVGFSSDICPYDTHPPIPSIPDA